MRAKENGLNPAVVALSVAVLVLALPALCQLNPNPPSSPQKLIFIHHSTGGNWLAAPDGNELGGDLGRALRDGNYFVSATNYDWGPDGIGSSTDIGHWWLWFRGENSATYTGALYAENGQNFGDFGSWPRLASDPGGPNTIVMFKSCFPNSNMGGSPSDPVPAIDSNPLRGQDAYSGDFTVGNAKGIYIDLLNYFQAHPEKLFVVIVQPPLMQSETSSTHAANARAFADWLVNDWLDSYPLRNVSVFDFFSVLTSNGGSNRKNDPNTNDLGWADGNHHRHRNGAIEHMKTVNNNFSAYWSGDSHPSRAGNDKATGEFIQLLNIAYNCWKGTGGCPGGPPVCTLTCTATAPASGTAGSALSFQSTATATNCSGGVTYGWNFGDGQTSSQQNPSHTYAAAGTFNWTFNATVTGAAPCTQNGSITITEAPVCTLTCTAAAPASGTVGVPVAFHSTATATNCTGGITYAWDFGDGSTSSEEDPSHTYSVAGTYSLTFTATVSGAQPCRKTGSITISDAPVCTVSCTASAPEAGMAGSPIAFNSTTTATNCTQQPSYFWNFGDGSTSAQEDPSHIFEFGGTYSWTFTASVTGAAPCTRTGTILIVDPGTCSVTCPAAANPASGAAPLTVAFTSSATATNCSSAISHAWNFGDGATSTEQNPSHIYELPGTFNWSYSATADGITCTHNDRLTVTGGGAFKTYHVRTDGGDATQCTGLADAAYPGSGTAQPCAWNHPFQAFPGGLPTIAGGDTLIIHNGSYMMGYGAPGSQACYQNATADCNLPPIPSGPDPSHPTRILGENAGQGCTASPELWGTERAYHILNLAGSKNVEIACLELTDHSSCIEDHNTGNHPCDGCTVRCKSDSYPFGNWAASGINASDSSNVLIRDVNIHGFAHVGIHAGRISDWTLERVRIVGNGWAGWDGDLWDASSNSGTLLFRDVEIAYNGCSEAYPAKTITMNTCWGQETGGYGDGLGTTTTGGKWIFEDCKIHHNTSDGLDLLYVDPTGSIEVRRLWAEGNAGNQLKTSGPAVVENSVIVGNCAYFADQPLMMEGDNCRAAGNALSLDVHRGNRVTLMNNTVTGQGDCLLIVGCNDSNPEDPDPNCDGTERVVVNNTLFYGNLEWNQADERTCLAWYDDSLIPADPLSLDYNLVYGTKDDPCHGTHDLCGQDPLLADPSIANFDGHLLHSSPAINRGTAEGAPAADFDRNARDAQPDIGAYEYRGAAQCVIACSATVPGAGSAGTPVQLAATATATDCADPLLYSWDFGDGSSGQGQNLEHTYASAGDYDWKLTASSGDVTCVKTGRIQVCGINCTATATPSSGTIPLLVRFAATAGLVNCGGIEATFAWDFGDGSSSSSQGTEHSYSVAGTYTWTMTASLGGMTCVKTGAVTARNPGQNIPGDCDGDGTVSIGEVQKAINMFLGALAPGCGVDCDGNGQISIGEVQKVINAFLGLPSSC